MPPSRAEPSRLCCESHIGLAPALACLYLLWAASFSCLHPRQRGSFFFQDTNRSNCVRPRDDSFSIGCRTQLRELCTAELQLKGTSVLHANRNVMRLHAVRSNVLVQVFHHNDMVGSAVCWQPPTLPDLTKIFDPRIILQELRRAAPSRLNWGLTLSKHLASGANRRYSPLQELESKVIGA